jgi:hypothetical protein
MLLYMNVFESVSEWEREWESEWEREREIKHLFIGNKFAKIDPKTKTTLNGTSL